MILSGSDRPGTQLAVLLKVHADAEEQLFYPRLLDVGAGLAGAVSSSLSLTLPMPRQ